jgi:PAS domain S-box-containing protein
MKERLDVLIVEDSADDLEMILLELQEHGFEPSWRKVDTKEAYIKALEDRPDLILSDWVMPSFSGLEALMILKDKGLDIPFIILSGAMGKEEAVMAIKEGATDYVLKDRMGRLGIAIRRALAERDERLKLEEARQALKAQQQFLETLIDCIPIPVFYKDREGRYLGCNQAYGRFLGMKSSEVLGKTVFEILPPEGAILHHSIDMGILGEGKAVQYEADIQDMESRNRVILIRKAPFKGPDGGIAGIISAFLDITEIREKERALKASEERYRLLAETSREIIVIHDMDGRITYANKAGLDLVGLKAEEALGREIMDFMPEDQRATLLERRKKREDGDLAPFVYETEFLNRSGERIPVEVSSAPIIKEGRAEAILIVARDIRERKRAEAERESLMQQLAQAQKMEAVGRLAGGVAHDFNNMLTAIIGFSDIATSRLGKDHPVQRDLAEILSAGRRSAEIVRQLLAFARKQKVEPRMIDLNETVEGLLKMLRRLLGENIDLAWRPQQGLRPLMIDPSQIDQVLANLCVNARDAISGEGHITIETQNAEIGEQYLLDEDGCAPGSYVALIVSDDGCGIPKDIMPKIFDPFFTTKEAGKGTGLGLSTVYGIVRQNTGFIRVYSEVGKGTCFKIYLPAQSPEGTGAKDKDKEEAPKGRGETLLIVEDEARVLDICEKTLKHLGYNTLAARRTEDAIRIAQTHT